MLHEPYLHMEALLNQRNTVLLQVCGIRPSLGQLKEGE